MNNFLVYSMEDCNGRRFFQGKVTGALMLFERLKHHLVRASAFAILFHCIHQCEVVGLTCCIVMYIVYLNK